METAELKNGWQTALKPLLDSLWNAFGYERCSLLFDDAGSWRGIPANMKPDDRIRLTHMAEALDHTIRFIEGRSRADLDSDPMLAFPALRAPDCR